MYTVGGFISYGVTFAIFVGVGYLLRMALYRLIKSAVKAAIEEMRENAFK